MINFKDYIKNLPDYKKCKYNHDEYLEWKNVDFEVECEFYEVGKLSIKPFLNESSKYWGKDTPMNLNEYPYYGCRIYSCKECNSLFFYYVELGYHYPQDRFRLIRKELINDHSLELVKDVVIDLNSSSENFFSKIKKVLNDFKRTKYLFTST